MTGLPLVGDEFAGYRTRAVLGRGGMSVVYQAENLRLSSVIALKVLAPELAADDVFRTRFLEESRIAASLNHPNVPDRHGERARAPRRQPQRRAQSELARVARTALERCRERVDLLHRPRAEEAHRDVEELGLQQAQRRRILARPGAERARGAAAPIRQLLAHLQRRIDSHEQPGCGTARHRRGRC